MKCKSNKARLVPEASKLGAEINAYFQLGAGNSRIISIKEADALGLLEGVRPKETFGNTWFASTDLTAEQFIKLRDGKQMEELVRACQNSLTDRQVAIELHEELVVVMMTDGGKYGMFLVEEITISSIQIEACHILL